MIRVNIRYINLITNIMFKRLVIELENCIYYSPHTTFLRNYDYNKMYHQTNIPKAISEIQNFLTYPITITKKQKNKLLYYSFGTGNLEIIKNITLMVGEDLKNNS